MFDVYTLDIRLGSSEGYKYKQIKYASPARGYMANFSSLAQAFPVDHGSHIMGRVLLPPRFARWSEPRVMRQILIRSDIYGYIH